VPTDNNLASVRAECTITIGKLWQTEADSQLSAAAWEAANDRCRCSVQQPCHQCAGVRVIDHRVTVGKLANVQFLEPSISLIALIARSISLITRSLCF